MLLNEAMMLIREKYREEQGGMTSGMRATEYTKACEHYPATMTTAHYLWATELAKNMP